MIRTSSQMDMWSPSFEGEAAPKLLNPSSKFQCSSAGVQRQYPPSGSVISGLPCGVGGHGRECLRQTAPTLPMRMRGLEPPRGSQRSGGGWRMVEFAGVSGVVVTCFLALVVFAPCACAEKKSGGGYERPLPIERG